MERNVNPESGIIEGDAFPPLADVRHHDPAQVFA